MKNLFSIGEMSKLHNTTIQALRYYDQIGLLVPIHIDENSGYRYYSTEQFEQLNTINYLKALGFSLKEIKEQLEHRDIESFLDMLEKQKQITEAKINELHRISLKFQSRMEEIQESRIITDIGIPHLEETPARKILRMKDKISSEPDWEVSLRKLENISNLGPSIFIGRVGLTIGVEHLLKDKFDEYNSIFILLDEHDVNHEQVAYFQSGLYASIKFRGNHNSSPKYYNILINYIQQNGLKIDGDSIERTIIDHYISKDPEDYLTEIQIPVKD
ncbi:MerR family transcriptional regulator [Paenibacillus turpanensis]|uniref:MerR family transcriptional regulator n=1 Tax=Paenibacillus turpanensis TaxID=2689078 RepID=UPI0014097049|nr:MerR family transcriptional regulator [Paenibacillus turpanensis]